VAQNLEYKLVQSLSVPYKLLWIRGSQSQGSTDSVRKKTACTH